MSAKRMTLFLFALASSCSMAAPAETAASAAHPSASAPVDASIATITRLSRELKIAQIKRELSDAQKATNTPAGQAVPSGAAGPLPGPLPAGLLPSSAPTARTPAVPQRPSLSAIAGMGGSLRAYLADGRELRVGASLSLSDNTTWVVKAIQPTFVSFEVCGNGQAAARAAAHGRAKQAAAEAPRCTTQSVAPTSA